MRNAIQQIIEIIDTSRELLQHCRDRTFEIFNILNYIKTFIRMIFRSPSGLIQTEKQIYFCLINDPSAPYTSELLWSFRVRSP